MNNELRPIHYFSRWTRIIPKYAKIMKDIERIIRFENEIVGIIPSTNDIWVRDFMPFLRSDGRFIFYNYSPDYLRGGQEKYMTDPHEAFESIFGDNIGLSSFFKQTNIILDGGNLIACKDRSGTDCIIMTNKIFKENPAWKRKDLILELKRIFLADVIIIPWDTAEKFGHADGMLRSIGDGKLLINCYKDIDEKFDYMLKDSISDRFDFYELSYGKYSRSLSWCHLNYLELENSIIVPTVGIKSDDMALQQIQEYTGKRTHPLRMREIVKEGGALHCISWTLKEPHRDVIEIMNETEYSNQL